MAKHDNIHSTEKLLNLIRQGKQSETSQNKVQTNDGSTTKQNRIIAPISFKKRMTVGVDIGHTYIRLAKISPSDKNPEILDYLHVPLTSNINVSDAKFQHILKSTLDRFCESPSSCDIWGAIQSANVETRSIRIPKVPRKQIANAVFWTFTKKIAFNENEEILDYDIIGEVTERGIKKIEVMAFKAPKSEINAIRAAFQTIGYPLKGISIVPFAIQNLFRSQAVDHSEKDTCCLFIGRDWSRIAIFNKGNLVISRGIKAGMRSMVEAINIVIQKQGVGTEDIDNQTSSNNHTEGVVTDAIHPLSQKLFFGFIGVSPPSNKDTAESESNYTNQHVFQMILPAMERLIRQIERTFEHYALNFNSEGVRRIFISGQITASKMAMDHIGKQLDLPIEAMNPFPANSPFTRHIRIPGSVNERESFVPSIGLALSTNTITPNFLYTHQDKNQYEQIRQNNMRILTICLITLMLLIGMFSWQERSLESRRIKIEELNSKLFTYNPPAEKNMLLALYTKTKNKRQTLQQIVHRYVPVAILAELSKITPPNIRLVNVHAKFIGDSNASDGLSSNDRLAVDGIIFGNPSDFEATLTSYLLSLKNSPMFKKPAVQVKQIEYFQGVEVLRFKAMLNVV